MRKVLLALCLTASLFPPTHAADPASAQQEASDLQSKAQQGDADAQASLGDLYYYGRGVKQDFAEAANWYHKAGEKGNVRAEVSLGTLYVNGFGVKVDKAKGAAWTRKAAEQDDAIGQLQLGTFYQDGIGVKQDDEEALKWFRKAAVKGHEGARAMLTARSGSAGAQYALCKMYEFGQGVKSDKAEAYFWISLAASQDAGYILLRDTIGLSLSKSQADAIKKRVARWKPRGGKGVKP